MFGNGFTYRPTLPQLENGEYEARITKVTQEYYPSNDMYLRVFLEIKGHRDAQPNNIFLNDRPRMGQVKANGVAIAEKDLENWDKAQSRFFECFGITDYSFNTSAWVGKTGIVKCAEQYDASEPDKKSKKYKQLFPQVKENKSGNAPDVQQNTQRAPQQSGPAYQQVNTGWGQIPSQPAQNNGTPGEFIY